MHTKQIHGYRFPEKVLFEMSAWQLYRSLGKDKLSYQAQLKLEWIIFYHTVGKENATVTAKHFGIARKTLYKWLKRFDEKNLLSLEEESRVPQHTRKCAISYVQRERITKLRKRICVGGR